MAAVYVWAVLKWYSATYELTTVRTTFRAWKINFMAFWVYVGVTAVDIILAGLFYKSEPLGKGVSDAFSSFSRTTGVQIGVGLGAPLVAAGIFFGWRVKQIWLEADPSRSMALEIFDYFIWEDEEPTVIEKTEDDTTIDNGPNDNEETTDDTKTDGDGKTTDTTTGGNGTTTGGNGGSDSTTTGTSTNSTETSTNSTTPTNATSTNSTAPATTTGRKGSRFLYELEDAWAVSF